MGEQRGQGNEMKASFAGMDIGYQADFDVPLFDVIPQAPELQARIYAGVRKLYPYALNMDDIHVATNGMQSDTGLRIKMFGGNASINLTPMRLAIDFSNLNVNDVEVCKNCIDLITVALNQTCANVAIHGETISIFLKLSGEGDAAGHLGKISAANVRIAPFQFGATEEYPVVAIDLGNPTDGWRSSTKVSADQNEFTIFCQSHYGSSQKSVSDRIDAQYRLIGGVLSRIQVELT